MNKYRLIDLIKNIAYFGVSDNLLIYFLNGKLFFNHIEFLLNEGTVVGGHLNQNNIISVSTNNRKFYFSKDRKLLFSSKLISGFLDFRLDCTVELFITDDSNYSQYDLSNNKILREYSTKFNGLYPSAHKHEILFFHKFPDSIVQCLYLSEGVYKWESNLEKYGKIRNVLCVVDHSLWIWTYDYLLIDLDVNTGKVIHDFYPLQQLFDQGKSWANFPMFNEVDKKLYFFEQDFFAAVNLEEQTTRVIWQEEGYHISLSVIHDDYIYFIGGKAQGLFKNGIGVFDRQKNEVVWQTEIELDDYVVLNQIQVADSKIYVLDNEGTLRIYERED